MNNAWKNLFRTRRAEVELDAELRDHLDRQVNDNIRRGMDPAAARRMAMLSLGGVEQVKEECRDERPAHMLTGAMRDVRHSVRALSRRPGFAALAILTMALGIGANTAVFSVVYSVLIRPLPFSNGDRLVEVQQVATKVGLQNMGFSAKEVADFSSQSKTLDGVAEHHTMSFLLLGGEEPLRVQSGVVSPGFFELLGVRPIIGRTFTDADNKHDAPAVLLLTNRFWEKYFGADPKIIGRVFQMNNRPHTVIGVLPTIPQYPAQDEIYMPVSHCPFRSSPSSEANRTARFSSLFARLKPGSTVEQARTDLAVIGARLAATYPEVYRPELGYATKADLLRDQLSVRAKENMAPLLAASLFVLMIACASVANLMLARVMRVERELAIRAALGATRGRLARQLLTESLLLSVTGGVIGLFFAPGILGILTKLTERFSTRAVEIRMDLPVLLFTLAVSVATGILFGLAPALAFRPDVNDALKEGGGKTSETRGRRRLRSTLVVAQLAFSFVLLAGAGLAIRSLWKLLTVNPGFRAERVLVMRVSPSFTKYNKPELQQALYRTILDNAHATPGVRSAALSSNYPLSPASISGQVFGPAFQIEGRPVPKGQVAPRVEVINASPEYLDAVGIPLVRGRWFTEQDHLESMKVVAINESMARHRWPGEDPIGKRVSIGNGGEPQWRTVVGIVADIKDHGLDQPINDEMFLPLKQGQFAGNLLVRTASDPEAMIRQLTRVVHDAGADIAVDRIQTLDQVRQESVASPRLTAMLLGLFAALALVITAVGLGGVLALGVSQRRQELGIRMALGASHASVVSMVLRQGLTLVGYGIAIGLPASLALTRLVTALLYDTASNDVLTLVSVSLLLMFVAAVACFVPARQATRIDPLIALRSE